ncbi:MAG: fibronectin type III domain-containing protein [Elusimicrobiota bacterium]|nr:fibronectin type III domain-containing protein [Elusimicrobiota bacterium]
MYGDMLYSWNGIGMDSEGNVYVAVIDYKTYEAFALKYNYQGEVIKTHVLSEGFDGSPLGIAFDRKYDKLYVSSYDEIHCFDKNLNFVNKQITRDLFPTYNYILYEAGLDVDKNGNVYTGGYENKYPSRYVGLKYAPELSGLLWATIGEVEPTLDYLSDMVAIPEGGMYIVGYEYDDQWNEEISVNHFTDNGVIDWKTNFFGWTDVTGLATDEAGNIYIGATFYDYSAAQLVKLDEAIGDIAWSVLDPYGWSLTQALVDEQNRIYSVGWPMEWVPGEDFYISRYLQESGADTMAPSVVTDLAAINISTDTVALEWTAPGDDGNEGTAESYDLRYSTAGQILSDTDFNNAIQAQDEPVPSIAGSTETFTLIGLTPDTTYYFAIKTEDEAGNISDLSNSTKAVTLSVEKYSISRLTEVPQIVVVDTNSNPLVSLVNIFESTNPASGKEVSFSISTFPAGATGQSLTKSSEATNAQGLADVQLRLGDIPAEYGVTATYSDCIPESSRV